VADILVFVNLFYQAGNNSTMYNKLYDIKWFFFVNRFEFCFSNFKQLLCVAVLFWKTLYVHWRVNHWLL